MSADDGMTVDEAGFADAFRREVKPQLAALETLRHRRLTRTGVYVGLTVGVSVIAVILALTLPGLDDDTANIWLYTGLVFGPVIAFLIYALTNKAFVGRVKDAVMPTVCRHVGRLSYERKPLMPPNPHRFRDLLLVDRFSVSHVEDGFEGRHRNIAFRLAEAQLSRRLRRRTRIRFKGLLLAIRVPVSFRGRVILAQDRGTLGNRLAEVFTGREHFEQVAFDDPAFEALFEVYADEPSEARRLLPPVFRETLVALARHNLAEGSSQPMRAAFDDGEFLIALPHRTGLFEVGSLRRPLANLESEMDRLLYEVTIPHRVIDHLIGDDSV